MKTIKKVKGMWDTHSFYSTVSHFHLSDFPRDGEYADICVVECSDGRWILVDDQGTSSDPKILDKYSEAFIEPAFFSSASEAEKYAINAIHKITGTPVGVLQERFADD